MMHSSSKPSQSLFDFSCAVDGVANHLGALLDLMRGQLEALSSAGKENVDASGNLLTLVCCAERYTEDMRSLAEQMLQRHTDCPPRHQKENES